MEKLDSNLDVSDGEEPDIEDNFDIEIVQFGFEDEIIELPIKMELENDQIPPSIGTEYDQMCTNVVHGNSQMPIKMENENDVTQSYLENIPMNFESENDKFSSKIERITCQMPMIIMPEDDQLPSTAAANLGDENNEMSINIFEKFSSPRKTECFSNCFEQEFISQPDSSPQSLNVVTPEEEYEPVSCTFEEIKLKTVKLELKDCLKNVSYMELVRGSLGDTENENNKSTRFKCSPCKKTFRFQSEYKRHLIKPHPPLNCSQCDEKFQFKSDYNRHVSREHGRETRRNFCKSCRKTLPSRNSFTRHLWLVHKSDKPYECKRCGRLFRALNSVRNHMQFIHKEKVLDDSDIIIRTTDKTTGRKPFVCKICNKCFVLHSSLIRHRAENHPFIIYECKYCNRSTRWMSNLRNHISRDHKIKEIIDDDIILRTNSRTSYKFACVICGLRFKYPSGLSHHTSIHYAPTILFKCQYCNYSSLTVRSLNDHVSKFHGDSSPFNQGPKKIKLEIDDEMGVSEPSNKDNERKNSHVCEVCQRVYLSHVTLERHRREYHLSNNYYECSICGKTGNIRAHIRTHIYGVHNKKHLEQGDIITRIKTKFDKSPSAIGNSVKDSKLQEMDKSIPYPENHMEPERIDEGTISFKIKMEFDKSAAAIGDSVSDSNLQETKKRKPENQVVSEQTSSERSPAIEVNKDFVPNENCKQEPLITGCEIVRNIEKIIIFNLENDSESQCSSEFSLINYNKNLASKNVTFKQEPQSNNDEICEDTEITNLENFSVPKVACSESNNENFASVNNESTSEPSIDVNEIGVNIEKRNSLSKKLFDLKNACSARFSIPYDEDATSAKDENAVEPPINCDKTNLMGATKSFVCDFCGRTFISRVWFYEHRLNHFSNNLYKCKFCKFSHKRKKSIKDHIHIEHKKKRIKDGDIIIQTGEGCTAIDIEQKPEVADDDKPAVANKQQLEVIEEESSCLKSRCRLKRACAENSLICYDEELLWMNDEETMPKSSVNGDETNGRRAENVNSIKTNGSITEKPFPCEFCGKSFNAQTSLSDHRQIHLSNLYVCKYCKFSNKIRGFVRAHVYKMHNKKNIEKGDIIVQSIKNRSTADDEEKKPKIVGGGNKFHLKQNEFKGTSLNNSRIERSFLCEICGKYFKTHRSLKEHGYRKHLSNNSFECRYCGKMYDLRASLQSHIYYIHSKERIHEGDVIQVKKLSDEIPAPAPTPVDVKQSMHVNVDCKLKEDENRKSHLEGELKGACLKNSRKGRINKIERSLPCEICGKYFKSHRSLKEHRQLKHFSKYLYECKCCGKTFEARHSARYHMYKVHCKKQISEGEIIRINKLTDKNPAPVDIVQRSTHVDGDCKLKEDENKKSHLEDYSELKCADKLCSNELYECKYCGRSYGLRQTTRNHIYKFHKINHINDCDIIVRLKENTDKNPAAVINIVEQSNVGNVGNSGKNEIIKRRLANFLFSPKKNSAHRLIKGSRSAPSGHQIDAKLKRTIMKRKLYSQMKYSSTEKLPNSYQCDTVSPHERSKRNRNVQPEDCILMNPLYRRCKECYDTERGMLSRSSDEFSCRFKKFRLTMNRRCKQAFLEADANDVSVWTGSQSSNKIKLSQTEACYVVKNSAPQFKKILENERDFINKYRDWQILSPNDWVSWKKATNCREICDKCSRTIFNFHLFCSLCGYTICQRCADSCKSPYEKIFTCPAGHHRSRIIKLSLAQIIPDSRSLLRTLETLNSQLQMVLQQHKERESTSERDGLTQESTDDCKCGVVSLKDCDASKFGGEYYFDGELLILNDVTNENGLSAFQDHWRKYRPVIVRNIDKNVNFDIWTPKNLQTLSSKYSLNGSVQDCLKGDVFVDFDVDKFWKGFIDVDQRSENSLLKLKDWPTDKDFAFELPEHYENFCRALPFPKYSHPDNGVYSLTTHLPESYLKPDLGPKLYCAYEMFDHPLKGSTNLHIDGSDACNLLMNVTIPKNRTDEAQFFDKIISHLEGQRLDPKDTAQVLENKERIGALWTIFKPEDTDTIRVFLEKIKPAGNQSDVIHDQMRYVHADLRAQLRNEYGVEGFTFVQMLGDAVFIPAGAAHQVQNLVCCIKMAEDFVSPEGINKCAMIDEEFRQLSVEHTNHEDKLQLPNVVVHSIKEAVRVMMGDVGNDIVDANV